MASSSPSASSTPASKSPAAGSSMSSSSSSSLPTKLSGTALFWGQRFVSKLSTVGETSSKESLQTVAKWIAFHRKHGTTFASILFDRMEMLQSSSKQHVVFLLINEVILLERNHATTISTTSSTSTATTTTADNNSSANQKWSRLSTLRNLLGEQVILKGLTKGVVYTDSLQFNEKFHSMLQEWEKLHAFGTFTANWIGQFKTMFAQQEQQQQQQQEKMSSSSSSTTLPQKQATEKLQKNPPDETADKAATPTTAATTATAVSSPPSTETQEANTDMDVVVNDSNTNDDLVSPPVIAPEDNNEASPNKPAPSATHESETEKDGQQQPQNDKDQHHSEPTESSTKDNIQMSIDDLVSNREETNKNDQQNEPTSPFSVTGSASAGGGAPTTSQSYDFESTGIPPADVNTPDDFMEPCHLIATLQIARDLRHDGAMQLSTTLQSLPEPVRQVCAQVATLQEQRQQEQQQLEQPDQETAVMNIDVEALMTPEQARDFSSTVASSVLDLDLDEQLSNVKMFHDIVKRQSTARRQLIRLLIQSRCQFGSTAAVHAFEAADRAKQELLQRKQILTDAMDLEGLDVVGTQSTDDKDGDVEQQDKELPPFTWYKPSHSTEEETPAKRQRVE